MILNDLSCDQITPSRLSDSATLSSLSHNIRFHSRPELFVHLRQADDIASTEGGQCAIKHYECPTVPTRQTEQVPVSYLLCRLR